MNPNWVLAGITGLGLVVNAVWTLVNMQMRSAVRQAIDELKRWMQEEYVPERICRLRMGVEK